MTYPVTYYDDYAEEELRVIEMGSIINIYYVAWRIPSRGNV